ncbi:putative glutathione s-transferase [Hibiscus syriacus]|uniref:Glutathione s-transferase n=1 Tax=Hibiscus syriacus TaxID=106335 RepID=A0A6A3BSS4_HIBSY|nr:putative glutathione s-transferase [Hibiscus syriacus]
MSVHCGRWFQNSLPLLHSHLLSCINPHKIPSNLSLGKHILHQFLQIMAFRSSSPKKVKGDLVAAYVAVGMIALSTSLGLFTVVQELKNSPHVRLNKKRRESLPEVEEPERVLDEADMLLKQSLFRKVAHIHKSDDGYAIDEPTRGPMSWAETLESVGGDPKFRVYGA